MMHTLDKAKKIAIEVCQKISPYCETVNIAGSIRRQKMEVHDIEILCVPKRVSTGNQMDIFGDVSTQLVVHPEFVRIVNDLGIVLSGKPEGRYMKIDLIERIQLDLFMPVPRDYFRQYAIRTGSSDYSYKVIASAWKANGWVGTEDGLRRIEECKGTEYKDGEKTKMKWACAHEKPTLPPAWESEEHFFEWLGIKWIHPKLRTI